MKASFPRALEIEAYAFSTLADAIEPQLQELSGDTATPPRERRAPHKPSGKTTCPDHDSDPGSTSHWRTPIRRCAGSSGYWRGKTMEVEMPQEAIEVARAKTPTSLLFRYF
jgi:hypothetical protein